MPPPPRPGRLLVDTTDLDHPSPLISAYRDMDDAKYYGVEEPTIYVNGPIAAGLAEAIDGVARLLARKSAMTRSPERLAEEHAALAKAEAALSAYEEAVKDA